jgi:hypothetical protein
MFIFKNIPGLRRLKKNMAALLVNDLNFVARRCNPHQATPPRQPPPPPPFNSCRHAAEGEMGAHRGTWSGWHLNSDVAWYALLQSCAVCSARSLYLNRSRCLPRRQPLVFSPSMNSCLQGLLVTRTVSFLCADIVSVVLGGHLVNKRDVPRRLPPDEPPPPEGG